MFIRGTGGGSVGVGCLMKLSLVVLSSSAAAAAAAAAAAGAAEPISFTSMILCKAAALFSGIVSSSIPGILSLPNAPPISKNEFGFTCRRYCKHISLLVSNTPCPFTSRYRRLNVMMWFSGSFTRRLYPKCARFLNMVQHSSQEIMSSTCRKYMMLTKTSLFEVKCI